MSEFLSELVGWKKVYVPLCILITFMAVLFTISLQNEKLIPDFGQSLLASLNMRTSNHTTSSTEYSSPSSCDVCLMVKVGDDGWQPPSEKNLPFLLLPRLFEAVQNLTNTPPTLLTDPKLAKKVCVGVDYPSIVCKMVRDSLGPEANCWNYTQIIHRHGGVRIRCDDMVVGNTSRFVNQMSIPGARSFRWQRMHLVDLDTVEDSPAFGQTHDEVRVDQAAGIVRPTIVTGFSGNHLSVGLLLLRSIGRGAQDARINHLRPDFNVSVVVWTMERFVDKDADDLRCVVAEMNDKWMVPTEVREFDFSAFPPWMQINQTLGYFGGTGEYAWKAVMIHRVLVERGFAHWQDAGCRFKTTASLIETLDYTAKHGFASRSSSGAIWHWTFPAQLQFLRAARVDQSTSNCDASSIGFTLERYKDLARPWYECSLIRQCIAPNGSDRSNHRQDQAALTVLAALSNNKCQGIHEQVGVHMDNNLGNLEGVNFTLCYKDPRRIDSNGR